MLKKLSDFLRWVRSRILEPLGKLAADESAFLVKVSLGFHPSDNKTLTSVGVLVLWEGGEHNGTRTRIHPVFIIRGTQPKPDMSKTIQSVVDIKRTLPFGVMCSNAYLQVHQHARCP